MGLGNFNVLKNRVANTFTVNTMYCICAGMSIAHPCGLNALTNDERASNLRYANIAESQEGIPFK